MQADKSHLHHKLLALGYSHRQTVLLVYSIAIMFGLSSVILYLSQPLGALHDVYPNYIYNRINCRIYWFD